MTDRPSVLILDDSLTVRMDLEESFREAGFRPLLCARAEEARQLIASEAVDLVVLDVLLPDAAGIDFLQELRGSAAAAAPVLILSTESEVRHRIRGLRQGADEFVGKPYQNSYVVARATELVRARRPHVARAPVLVIDDSATSRELLRAAFSDAGYEVLTATSGEEGLRLAPRSHPIAVLVDGELPGVAGATVVRRLRLNAALRNTPCLLLSSSDSIGAELHALDAGVDGFVRKQQDLTVILARLASILRGSPAAAADPTVSLQVPKRVLAVDDSRSYLEELARALRSEGYDVVLAASGEEALELLPVQPVDCILLDLLMPGLSGEETCRRIKSTPVFRDIPLILLTALEDRDALISGFATGADDYIAKSSDFAVVRARLWAQIQRRQFEDETRRIHTELLRRELEAAEARAAREVAETRAAMLAELQRKNSELEAFSYSVSHDLRAPLRCIDGFSQALLEDYGQVLDETGQGYLSRVRASAQRMGELIDALLELSRVGRARLEWCEVDLAEIARTVIHELAHREPARAVETIVADALPARGDPRLLRIALENLLVNAWKFTSGTSGPRIEFAGEGREEDRVVYVVRDNGAGFSMEHAGRLFEPFQRLHSQSEFSGTGIGLATVHRIIDRHGGRVWAEAAPGLGAALHFTLSTRSAGEDA